MIRQGRIASKYLMIIAVYIKDRRGGSWRWAASLRVDDVESLTAVCQGLVARGHLVCAGLAVPGQEYYRVPEGVTPWSGDVAGLSVW